MITHLPFNIDLSNLILILIHQADNTFSGCLNSSLEFIMIYDLFIFLRYFIISYCWGYPNSSTEFNLFFLNKN